MGVKLSLSFRGGLPLKMLQSVGWSWVGGGWGPPWASESLGGLPPYIRQEQEASQCPQPTLPKLLRLVGAGGGLWDLFPLPSEPCLKVCGPCRGGVPRVHLCLPSPHL